MDLALLARKSTMVAGRLRNARPQAESGELQPEARAEAARLILLFVLNAARGRTGNTTGRGPELAAQFENEDRNGRSVHQEVAMPSG